MIILHENEIRISTKFVEALGRTFSNKLPINDQTSFGACPENLTLQVTVIRSDFGGKLSYEQYIKTDSD